MEKKIEKSIVRQQLSTRGGGIEIKLDAFGYKGELMTAYQNYLGGGMLGRIMNDCTIRDFMQDEKLSKVAEELRKYMHELTNPDTEWEGSSFEDNQNRPINAY